MDAFGIFEGGGAKGLAHVGALKAAEERRVKFIGVAGTSAGAMVAALVAAGYTADELFDPGKGSKASGVLAADLMEFFDRTRWQEFCELKKRAWDAVPAASGPFRAGWAAIRFALANRASLTQLLKHKGFLSTDAFSTWFDELLRRKTRTMDDGSKVTFDEVRNLKVVVTDLTNQCPKVFCANKTPRVSVSDAVAASISIPFAFVPVVHDKLILVDGGLSSNYPAWAFDVERKRSPPLTPTLGFRLVPRQDAERGDTKVSDWSIYRFASSLFKTAAFGDYSLETREVQGLHEIPLLVRAGTFDFEMDEESRANLYQDGKNGARDFFNTYHSPDDPTQVIRALRAVHASILRSLKSLNSHLRAFVLRPISDSRLKVIYAYNAECRRLR